MTVEWKTPPPAKRGRTATRWKDVAAQLRENPNTWAFIGKINFASQGHLISRNYNLKVVTRQASDGTIDVYAMHEESES